MATAGTAAARSCDDRLVRHQLVGATLLAMPLAGLTGAASPTPTPVFRLVDPSITESSGLAVSSYDDRVVYTHNDSGDAARFFAIDAGTGATLASYRVPGATNVDWEDMAAAPEEAGRPSLWLADIGDNRGRRAEVVIYRVPEPRAPYRSGSSAAVTTLRLRYPDGPHDAEALLVDSRRAAVYVATKSLSGQTSVYATQLRPAPASTLRLVANVELGFGAAVTGGAVSRAGDRLVLRTYAEAYVWPLDVGGVPAALRAAPRRVPLPAMPQGESVAFRADGSLLVGSEGSNSAVYAVRLPSPVRLTPGPTTRARASTPEPRKRSPADWSFLEAALVVAVATLAAGLGGWTVRRRRGRRAVRIRR